MELFEFLVYALAGLAVFLLIYGLALPKQPKGGTAKPNVRAAQERSRSERAMGGAVSSLARAGVQRASADTAENARFLRLLKKADWYWAPGEPMLPNARAPFWSLETLWTEKFVNGALYGLAGAVIPVIFGLLLSLTMEVPVLIMLVVSAGLGLLLAMLGYGQPDEQLRGAAIRRQAELALEMGYRISELRADVQAGLTIQRAITELAARPGGPFVEELRRVVAVLRTRDNDDIVAMDYFIDRNRGNELVEEFANQVKLVSQRGGQISHALNVLADSAQQRLKVHINTQAAKNLSAMQLPLSGSQVFILTMLVIVPVVIGIFESLTGQ
jgi:Flp pilus assembly protein TadB